MRRQAVIVGLLILVAAAIILPIIRKPSFIPCTQMDAFFVARCHDDSGEYFSMYAGDNLIVGCFYDSPYKATDLDGLAKLIRRCQPGSYVIPVKFGRYQHGPSRWVEQLTDEEVESLIAKVAADGPTTVELFSRQAAPEGTAHP